MLFTLVVTVRDTLGGDTRELVRQFDPATPPATLSTKWNALSPAVLAMVTDLQTAAATQGLPAAL